MIVKGEQSEYILDWIQKYQDNNDNSGYDISLYNDTAYICGKIDDGTYWQAPTLLRYEVNGTLLDVNKTWGGSRIKIYNNSIFMLNVPNYGLRMPRILTRLDLNLNEIWSVPYPNLGQNYIVKDFSIDESTGIYVAGMTKESNTSWNSDALLLKFSMNGTYEWNRTFVGSYTDYYTGVVARNGEIYAGGGRNSSAAPNKMVLLIRYDSDGNQIWKQEWDGSGLDNCLRLEMDNNNDIVIYGYTESFGSMMSLLLMKYTPEGNQTWLKHWDSGCYNGDLVIDNNNNIFIGILYDFTYTQLIKYDSSGNFQWNISWESLNEPYITGIEMGNSNEIYLVGSLGTSPKGSILLMKYIVNVTPELPIQILPMMTLIALFIVVLKRKRRAS